MKAVEFKEVNTTFAKDQPQYHPLPGHKYDEPEGRFVFCMKMSFIERLRVLFTGRVWCSLMTFNNPLTPSRHSTKKSDLIDGQS